MTEMLPGNQCAKEGNSFFQQLGHWPWARPLLISSRGGHYCIYLYRRLPPARAGKRPCGPKGRNTAWRCLVLAAPGGARSSIHTLPSALTPVALAIFIAYTLYLIDTYIAL